MSFPIRRWQIPGQPRIALMISPGTHRITETACRVFSAAVDFLLLPITVRSSLLKNFCPRRLTFFVNRIRSPIDSAICFRSNTLSFGASSSGSCFSTPSFPRMTASS